MTSTISPAGANSESAATGAVLTGSGVSAGAYVGAAHVVTQMRDIANFRDGDVLVCAAYKPWMGWPLLRAGAVVVEVGGALSAPAILAREYQVPGVFQADGAARMINSGDRVRVDGNTGEVRIVAVRP